MRILLLTTLLVIGFSCEEPLDRNIPVPEAKLVVSSTFFPRENVKVGLTTTFSVLTGDETRVLRNADISLFSGTQLLEKLEFFSGRDGQDGYYSTVNYQPSIGVDYTLHVVVPGFDPISAVSSIPPPVDIRYLKLVDVQKRQIGPFDDYLIGLLVDYDDPEGLVNFYNLRLLQEKRHYMIAFNGDTIYTHNSYVPIDIAESVDGSYSNASGGGSILLQDRPTGQPLELRLKSRIEREAESLGQIYAELRTVSPEYYFYQRSLSRQGGTTIGGGITPTNAIQSNVENGTGIFAGYAFSSDSIRINR